MDDDAFLVSVMRLLLDNYGSDMEDLMINLHIDGDISDSDVYRLADMHSVIDPFNFDISEDQDDG